MKLLHITAAGVGLFLLFMSMFVSVTRAHAAIASDVVAPRLAHSQDEEDRILDELDDTANQIEREAGAKRREFRAPEIYQALENEEG